MRVEPRTPVIRRQWVARPGTVVLGQMGPTDGATYITEMAPPPRGRSARQRRRGPPAVPAALFACAAQRVRSPADPTLAGLEDDSAARKRHQCQDEAEGPGLEDRLHHQQSHRMPAPVARAIDASSMTAQVKRARFAFTCSLPSNRKVDRTLGSAAGRPPKGDPWPRVPASRRVCPGRSSSGVTKAARHGRYGPSATDYIARRYWYAEVLGSVQQRTVARRGPRPRLAGRTGPEVPRRGRPAHG